MSLLRLALTAALIALPATAARADDDVILGSPTGDFLGKARQEMALNQPLAALPDLLKAIEGDPNNLEAYVDLSRVYGDLGDADRAASALSKAIALDGQSSLTPAYYYDRAAFKEQLGDDDGAVADYSEAIRLQPDMGPAFEERGYARLEMGDRAGGTADIQQGKDLLAQASDAVDRYQGLLIRPEPRSPRYFCEVAREQRLLGEDNDALTTLTQGIELDHSYAPFFELRALLYYNDHDFGSALSDLREADALEMALTPSTATTRRRDPVQLRSFLCAARMHRLDEARENLHEYLRTRGDLPGFDWPGRLLHFLAGDFPESSLLTAVAPASERGKRLVACQAAFYEGSLHLLNGDKPGAIDLFKKCLATRRFSCDEYVSAKAELRELGVKTD